MRRKIVFLAVPLILNLFSFNLSPLNRIQPFAEEVKTLKEAPDFILSDINEKSFKFSDIKGKVIILNFWATWCPPCRQEIPHFVSLYEQYKEKGLEIVGISMDKGGVPTVKPFAKKNEINYPILIGTDQVARDYDNVRALPTTFIINRHGLISEKIVVYRDKETFESIIRELL